MVQSSASSSFLKKSFITRYIILYFFFVVLCLISYDFSFQVLYQELNECQSEISSLSQSLNGINQHFSVETTSDIKEKLIHLKTTNNEYLKQMHNQMQTVSNIISEK